MGEPETDLPRRLGLVVERGDFSVPPYPAAAMRLRTLLESNKFGLSQVAEAAGADPALAAALLRVANSSLYRGDGPPLTTLLRAVNRLGARAVSSLALAAGIGAEACAPGPLADVKYRVWRRSITCALGAQRFAATRGVEAEAAFLAGLLHGFGRSVALACVEKLISGSSRTHTADEWLALVETHRAPLADRVARAWQLPETIVEAMSSNAPSEQAMPALVAFADRLAGALDQGRSAREIVKEFAADAKLASLIEKFVDHLPGALDALLQPPDQPAKKFNTSLAPAVQKPTSALNGELRPVQLEITDLRKGASESFECVGVAALGIVVMSRRPLQESSVIRLRLRTEPQIEAWFNVMLCSSDRQQRYRVELQAFAPSDDLRERLAILWASAAVPPPLLVPQAEAAPRSQSMR